MALRRSATCLATFALAASLVGCGSTPIPSRIGAGSPALVGGLPALGLANVGTDAGAARSAMIKRSGGVVTATAANGVIYTLTIPPGALDSDTNVGLYPVTAIDTLVKSGALVGGVQFTPEGVILGFPATLSMQVPPEIDLTHVVGFAYSGDAADPDLRPALVTDRTITIKVRHFSGIGASRTYADLLGVWGGLAAWQQAIFQEIENPNRTMESIADILRTQYTDVVRPALGACTNVDVAPFAAGAPCDLDGSNAAEAQFAYEDWRNALLYVQLQFDNFTVSPELEQSKILAAMHLQDWYLALNDRCRSLAGNSIVGDSAGNPIRWAGQALAHTFDWATEWGIATSANALDLESLLDKLCAKVFIDPSRSYSASGPGDTGTLVLNAGVTVETTAGVSGPVRHDLPIQVKVTGAAENAVGVTDSQGDYRVDLNWPPEGVDPIKIDILASINVENPNVQRIARFDRITKSSGPGRIVWQSTRGGHFDIYSMNADGSSVVRLTTSVQQAWSPAWSPDGTKIAYYDSDLTGTNLVVMDADGANHVTVATKTYNVGRPAWSPDGSRIVFQAFDGHDMELYVVDANGANRAQLTSNDEEDGEPNWSPDGTEIVFVGVRDGRTDIHLMNADGTGEVRLTSDADIDFFPSFSPDGTHILFGTQRHGVNEIVVMRVDGIAPVALAGGRTGEFPAWSPDGSKVVFAKLNGNPINTDIFVMNADGTNVVQLTKDPGNDILPSWTR